MASALEKETPLGQAMSLFLKVLVGLGSSEKGTPGSLVGPPPTRGALGNAPGVFRTEVGEGELSLR